MTTEPIGTVAASPAKAGRMCAAAAFAAARQDGLAGDEPALISDADGRIVQCSDAVAALLMRRRETLLGHGLDEVICDLPLSARTPGYNVAYARMRRGSWQHSQALAADGCRVEVDLMLDLVDLRSRFLIVVTLSPPSHGLQGHP